MSDDKIVSTEHGHEKSVSPQSPAPASPALLAHFDENNSDAVKSQSLKKINLDNLKKKSRISRKEKKELQQNSATTVNKEELIKAAKELLTLAGESIESLQGSPKRPSRLLRKKEHRLTEKENFTNPDIAIVTGQEDKGGAAFKPSPTPHPPTLRSPKRPLSPIQKSPAPTPSPSDDPFDVGLPQVYSEAESSYNQSAGRTDSPRPLRRGFFHYFGVTALGIGLLSLLVYVCFFVSSLFSGDNSNETGELFAQKDLEAERLPAEGAAQYVRTILEPESSEVADAREVIANFMGAESRRFAYAFVIQDDKTASAFNQYWEQAENYNEAKLRFLSAYLLPNKSIVTTFSYQERSDLSAKLLRLIRAPGASFRIDWKSYRQVEDKTIADVLAENSTHPILVRARVTPTHYYTAKYTEKFWQNYKAYGRDESIDCYVSLQTSSARKLYEAVQNSKLNRRVSSAEVIMLVRKPEIGANYCEILEVLQTSWDPTEL